MNRRLPQLAAIIAVCTLAFAVLPINAGDAADPKDQLTVVVYPIHDLPVYMLNENGLEFDPSIVIAHIKAEVNENSWKQKVGVITPHEETISLVIRQTRESHRRIADLLASLRGKAQEEKLRE